MISFNVPTNIPMEFLEFFIDCWFLFEITMNFFTGYYDKGVLIMHLPTICRNYARTYLFIDCISSIPLSFLSI